VSYAHFKDDREPSTEASKVNPKFGVQWDVTPDLRLRAAYFETMKPALAANRTLEPTQVAGFNQFFDEANATKSRRYGFGLDWQATPDLAIGGEMTWRKIGEPFINASVAPSTIVEDDATEQLDQVYVYWTPWDEVVFRAGFVYDKYEKDSAAFSAEVGNDNPLQVETISAPVSVSYFHPSGFFATAGVAFVHQDVERLSMFSNQGQDSFFVVDAGIGYRFPDRLGIASLTVHNLLDKGFQYQDDSFREFRDEPTVGPYIPSRTILGRVTLNF
jgi:outer membrane receptor protein involved in Fe transport